MKTMTRQSFYLDTKNQGKVSNIIIIIIMLMLVTDILVCIGILLVIYDAASITL